jgi:hypothetical protein
MWGGFIARIDELDKRVDDVEHRYVTREKFQQFASGVNTQLGELRADVKLVLAEFRRRE